MVGGGGGGVAQFISTLLRLPAVLSCLPLGPVFSLRSLRDCALQHENIINHNRIVSVGIAYYSGGVRHTISSPWSVCPSRTSRGVHCAALTPLTDAQSAKWSGTVEGEGVMAFRFSRTSELESKVHR